MLTAGMSPLAMVRSRWELNPAQSMVLSSLKGRNTADIPVMLRCLFISDKGSIGVFILLARFSLGHGSQFVQCHLVQEIIAVQFTLEFVDNGICHSHYFISNTSGNMG